MLGAENLSKHLSLDTNGFQVFIVLGVWDLPYNMLYSMRLQKFNF